MTTKNTPTKHANNPERATLDISEVAKRLGISRNSAYAAAQRGEIPVIRVGNRLLVPIAKLDALLGAEPASAPGRKGANS